MRTAPFAVRLVSERGPELVNADGRLKHQEQSGNETDRNREYPPKRLTDPEIIDQRSSTSHRSERRIARPGQRLISGLVDRW